MKNVTIILTAIAIMACNEMAPVEGLTCEQVRAELVEAEASEMQVWDDYEASEVVVSNLSDEVEILKRELQSTYVEIERISARFTADAQRSEMEYAGLLEMASDLESALWSIDRDILRWNCVNGNIIEKICNTMNIYGNGE